VTGLALQLQRERAFQDVDRHRKAVRVEQRPVPRLEARGEDAHFLPLPPGHALENFLQDEIGPGEPRLLRERGRAHHKEREGDDDSN
jgi:hypothetical protein